MAGERAFIQLSKVLAKLLNALLRPQGHSATRVSKMAGEFLCTST